MIKIDRHEFFARQRAGRDQFRQCACIEVQDAVVFSEIRAPRNIAGLFPASGIQIGNELLLIHLECRQRMK